MLEGLEELVGEQVVDVLVRIGEIGLALIPILLFLFFVYGGAKLHVQMFEDEVTSPGFLFATSLLSQSLLYFAIKSIFSFAEEWMFVVRVLFFLVLMLVAFGLSVAAHFGFFIWKRKREETQEHPPL
ncbi:hypothetical protein ACFYKX_11390 [Cytobacillus sp. FJAT-54145]|uniref:Uncharacterized protein n=1 Tax=Cytobacillus spartinae TaxID=3299023 RepID=A0ABW6KBU8_9BACI